MTNHSQRIPTNWEAREVLREKGQFWTPAWVATAMVSYLLANDSREVFDPALGAGAFFHAAKAVARATNRTVRLRGSELDPMALEQARRSGLTEADLAGVTITDFVLAPPNGEFSAIVANPPYIRHHRIGEETKAKLREFGRQLIGTALDGRAGYHIYFLLRALSRLAPHGRLAFIMPADTVEGKFATILWEWITAHFRLDAVITFAPEASPFPNVDTNAIVFLITNDKPTRQLWWARCTAPSNDDLLQWVMHEFLEEPGPTLRVQRRDLTEGLRTGLSRQPQAEQHTGFVLGDFARAMRGIATGDNGYFFLTREQAQTHKLPAEFLRTALGRTRDVPGDTITEATVEAAAAAGRPTLLFAPDGRPIDQFPATVQTYLKIGVELKLADRKLISQRKPWYKMEVRPVPPFLFAYLGRRHARFIRNFAGVLPLTSFLCVYPYDNAPIQLERLWAVLAHPLTINNLPLVGKSYGAGAIKVEPRALERLPLPQTVVEETGLVREDILMQLGFAL